MRTRGLLVLVAAVLVWWPTMTSAEAASSVIALWHMGDSGTVMTDASGNALNGTLTNVTTGQPGAIGHAYAFMARPSYVTVPSSTNLNPNTSSFAVTLHIKLGVKPTPQVGDYDLIRKGLSATPGGNWKIEILGTGAAFCQFQGTESRVTLSRGPSLADNIWHTVTCRRTGTGVRLTIDGAAWSKAGTTGAIANSSAVRIGNKDASGGDQYPGLMDEVRVSVG
jgi:hypothetical protein